MNRRERLLAILIFVVVLGALASVNGRVLVVALPLLVYLGAGVLSRPRALDLEISRTLGSTRLSAGAPVEVTVSAANRGAAVEELHLTDMLPPSVAVVRGTPRHFGSLSPGGNAEWSYTVRAERGEHTWTGVRAAGSGSCDPGSREADFDAESRLLVLPAVERLPRIRIRPRQTRGFAGPIPARIAGSGVYFYGVREYRMGDTLRRVNWKLSARDTRTIYTNEFEQERIADVGVILDARDRSYPGRAGGALFESAVSAAASLADTLLADGNRVALLIYGRSMERLAPGYGKVQRERIRVRLARAHTGTNYSLETLERLPTRMFPARSQIVLVSPVLKDDSSVLCALRSVGYSLLVVRPRRIAAAWPALAAQPEALLARRLENVENALLDATLRGAGIRSIDWDTAEPLARSLHAAPAEDPRVSAARTGRR
jgi:uncharacterized protein (DUF58 family)